jgi:phosphoglucomutase
MEVSPLAGKPAIPSILIDVSKLTSAYYAGQPDPSVPAQRVAFGTSGHRGCSLDNLFNEAHILAITQAICLYRKQEKIDGPLYMGFDTHALSEPAFRSALEVLAGNGVDVIVDAANSIPPPRLSRMRSSATIAAESMASLMVLSSRHRTIHRDSEASSTILHMEDPRTLT